MVLSHRRNRHCVSVYPGQSSTCAAAEEQRDGLCFPGRTGLHHQTIPVARRLAPLRRLQRPECVRGFRRMEIRLSCVLLAATLLCGCSWFHRGHKAAPEIVAEQPQAEPSIIEPQVTRRVVKTPHIKAKDFELGAYYGALSIQDFGTNPLYGVRAAYQ